LFGICKTEIKNGNLPVYSFANKNSLVAPIDVIPIALEPV
jgi:hypothetical protein